MNLNSSQVEPSSCQCMTLLGEVKKTKNYVLRILQLWQDTQEDSRTDIGHFSDLDQKRNGTGQTRTSRMENELMLLNTCCSTSVKADIPYFAEQVLWNEELYEAKEVERCLNTSVETQRLQS